MPELVINVSNIISPLCYSVIRFEPFTACSHSCIYCYAQWYRSTSDSIKPRLKALKEFKVLARKTLRQGLKPIPIRISTLVDPFQPIEELERIVLRALHIALDYEYSVIINTKGLLYSKDPWRSVIARLLDRGLGILQISITTLDDGCAKILEPVAPPPSTRLAVAKEFGLSNLPVVLRLSPFIPHISTYPSVDEFVSQLADAKVSHIIVEALRIEQSMIPRILQILKAPHLKFEKYSLGEAPNLEPVYRIDLKSRIRDYVELQQSLIKKGIGFSTCKEGLFHLHTTTDCCGVYLLKSPYILRFTLYDVYRDLLTVNKIDLNDLETFLESRICRYRLCSKDMKKYPKRISKPLKHHEKKLLRVIRSPRHLSHITPLIRCTQTHIEIIEDVLYQSLSPA
uniref:Radical SAM protein n=1 Tax=Ignisphaera aggregans TaxID=334771 RepID=A0A7C2VNQ5_9CREN